MKDFSNRIQDIEPSATVRIGDLADKRKSNGYDVIDLSVGDPDFHTPEHICAEAKTALDRGKTHYTESNGIPQLRDAIATKLQEDNSIDTTASNVTVTPGAKQGLFEVLFALVNDGDEVALLDPSWVSYEAIVTMCGGRVRRIPLDPETGFTIGSTDIANKITDDTKVIIINTPTNPTGAVLPRDDLEKIRDLAVDHDAWVIADEIYEKINYGPNHVSIASMEGMKDRTVTINGFSKSYAMTGWRVGYYAAPDRLSEQANKVQSHTVTCATSFAQYGALAALEGPQQPVKEMREKFRTRRDAAVAKLAEENISIPSPDGAFYLFVPTNVEDDVALCETLLKEKDVAVTPGSAFGLSGYIRISYANSESRVIEGISRIADHLSTI